jgi:osmotically-inducible protein OsmY
MPLFDFMQNVGDKLESARQKELQAARDAAQAEAAAEADAEAAARQAAADEAARAEAEYNDLLVQALADHVADLGLTRDEVQIAVDGGLVTLTGVAPDAETREKLVLAVGNVYGVEQVDDQLDVAEAPEGPAAPEPIFYTVQKGDTLSKISAHFYGKGGLYRLIFEANKPMLKDADKIYVGQMLRIPAKPE